MGNRCYDPCTPAYDDHYACLINDPLEGEFWEECEENCPRECLPGQWKCNDQCIDQSETCGNICKPSKHSFFNLIDKSKYMLEIKLVC